MENLKQSLLECLADWLNNEYTQAEMNDNFLKDNEDLHLKMSDAAFKVLISETKEKTK